MTALLDFEAWLAAQPDTLSQPITARRAEHERAQAQLDADASEIGRLKREYAVCEVELQTAQKELGDRDRTRTLMPRARKLRADIEDAEAVADAARVPADRADRARKEAERAPRRAHGVVVAEALVQRAHAFFEAVQVYTTSRTGYRRNGGGDDYPRPSGPAAEMLRIVEDVLGVPHR